MIDPDAQRSLRRRVFEISTPVAQVVASDPIVARGLASFFQGDGAQEPPPSLGLGVTVCPVEDVHRVDPDRPCVVVGTAVPGTVERALEFGAAAVVATRDAEDFLPAAVRAVAEGADRWYSPSIAALAVDAALGRQTGSGRLTDRERNVLALVESGYSNAEIAERLCLSRGTVKNYVSRLLRKRGASRRAHLIVRAS